MKTYHLDHDEIHQEWNNALPPRLEVDPGDTVVFETRDAANRFYSRASTHDDVLRRGPFRGHPLTGPVKIRDAHAAQGDGEVCVTAVEMMGRLTLRFGLQSGRRLAEPRLRTPAPPSHATNRGPHYATTAHGPDLFASSQQAVRYMIEHLVEERGLSREQAYVVCSVAVDLKISEIVDAPNWIVSAFLPESIFV